MLHSIDTSDRKSLGNHSHLLRTLYTGRYWDVLAPINPIRRVQRGYPPFREPWQVQILLVLEW